MGIYKPKDYLVKERMCVGKPWKQWPHNTEYNSEHCDRCHRPKVLDDDIRAIKPFLWEIAEESMKQGDYISWKKTQPYTCKNKFQTNISFIDQEAIAYLLRSRCCPEQPM